MQDNGISNVRFVAFAITKQINTNYAVTTLNNIGKKIIETCQCR